jgi:uncharacterized alpha-E superfamily protein
MPYAKMRIEIPTDAQGIVGLARLIWAKHQKEGATSPLNAMETSKWEETSPLIATASAKQERIDELEKELKTLYATRDQALATLLDSIKSSRDILSGVMRQNMMRLGEWGFVVHEPRRRGKTPENPTT